ncbi:HutD family protein [Paenarthrobacter sp. NPDC058040]|uniref:HutD/Ves family protein n=1 Tax=unclassified Paenarthrobacter TaxID=2634190 RepID=UPI0036D769E5
MSRAFQGILKRKMCMREPADNPIAYSAIVHPAQRPPVPWVNGAGVTREIAVKPLSDGSGPFLWRLSLAELDRDGDFSSLPGIDRIFTLASPGPLDLAVSDVLGRIGQGESIAFPGEKSVKVWLVGGSKQLGLNLMVRRDRAMVDVSVVRQEGILLLDPRAGTVAATVLEGQAVLADGRWLKELGTVVLGDEVEQLRGRNCLLAISSVYPSANEGGVQSVSGDEQ